MFINYIESLIQGKSLTSDQASDAMRLIMEGSVTDAEFGSFVTAMRIKNESVDEIVGMAKMMRSKSLKVVHDLPVLDTCGTGGDGSKSFNISTTAAFVIAGAGVNVAKHGNRAMSSFSGSADVLEKLGANIDLDPEDVKKCIEDTGFGFMFAQRYHPSMKFAAKPRKDLGLRTVFNILGPLTNPANARFHLLGVADPSTGKKMAESLFKLGSNRALIVHGKDKLDEISLSANTLVWELQNGLIDEYEISPSKFGFKYINKDDIQVEGVDHSIKIINNVLNGYKGPHREIVLINSAVGLVVSGKALDIETGISLAMDSIDTGKALKAMKSFIKLSQELKKD
ncbi:MAG: anthranilate phosphoribosyltransferase [Chloroflexi bacterium]|nr:anthranilate phosphoribosyltransferase [Chloroflexota bacterium]|tara:strand:+ start:23452 stop:24471 length:1020 start_codon:yes stop_codon:yes gene_type:complete